MDLINAQKMECIKVLKHILIFESELVQKVLLCGCRVSCDPTHALCCSVPICDWFACVSAV